MKKWLVTMGYTVAGITVAAGLSLGSFALAGHQIGHYGNVQPVAVGETNATDTGTSPASLPTDLGTLPTQQPSTSHPGKGGGEGSGASGDTTVNSGSGTGSSGSGFAGKSTGATGSPSSHGSDGPDHDGTPDPSGTPSPHTCPSPSPSSGHSWNGCGDD